MIDTYNRQIQYDVSCTIRTNINTANHHFIVEQCNSKENISTPTKVSTGTQHKSSSEDNLGGISRTVKTDDSLAALVMEEVIVYDDYNQKIPKDQTIIGTITTQIGNPAPRHGYRIIEVKKMEESILIPEATAKGYAEATEGDSVNLEQPNSKTRRGRVGKQMANTLTTSCNQGVVVSEPKIEPPNPYKDGTCRTIKAQYQQSSRANFTRQDGLSATGVVQIGNIYPDTDSFKNRTRSPTLRTVTGGHNEPKVVEQKQPRYRIRKLTPRECFRLMDVDDKVIDKIQAAGISNSQQYKLAGNSIVVACLEKIFEQMFYPRYTNSGILF